MSDKIPSIDAPTKDRESLNVGGQEKKRNKSAVIGAFLLIGLAVIVGAALFSFGQFDEPEIVEPTVADTNFNAGFDKSALDDSNNYFDEMERQKEREEAAEKARLARAQAQIEAQQQAEADKAKPPVVVERKTNTPPRQPTPRVTPSQSSRNNSSRGSSNKNAPPTPEQRKLMGAVTLDFGGGQNSSVPPPPNYDDSFNASSFANGSASLRKAGALDFMLMHGTAIPCALYTQIISDYQGFVTCRVTQDVYSANGAALLVERGSLVSGTQNVAMELGKARIFTNWADIETPLGVSIRIDSLGTGALGASGHEAWVDNHFSERFGGAIMLSFVDDALGALSAQASDNSNIQFDNSTENAGNMAEKALEATINIAPTGYSFIGQRINILVARDIDMSSIYHWGEE
ncbi:TrbI/VirB10 family protein [Vibrio chagasii]|uniref:TrbI/VirB10 family protein n=1 Tax=Vibrio chagasii TaxID=170679 RepID=UPI003735332E